MLILLAAAALATPHAMDFAWTGTFRARSDALMSPLVHTGVGPIGGTLAYRWRGPHNGLMTALEFDQVPGHSGPLFTFPTDDGEARTYPSSWFTLRIPTGWGRDLVPGDDLDVVVGGLFDVRIEVLSWSYGVTWTSGYSGAFTLGPWVDVRWRPAPKWSVEGSFTAPLGGWVTRSPYAVNDDDFILANRTHDAIVTFGAYFGDGHPVWLGNYQALRLRAGATYALSDTASLVAAYRFEVLHDPNPAPVLAYGHAIEFGVRVAF